MTSPTPAPSTSGTTTGGSMATGCGALLAMLVLVLITLFAIQRCSSGGTGSPPAEVRTEDTSAPPVTSVSTTVPESTSSTGSSAPPATAQPPVVPPIVEQPDTPPAADPSPGATPSSSSTTLIMSRTYSGSGDAVVTVERPIVAGTRFYCTYTGGRQFNLRVGTEVLVSAPIGNWTGTLTYQGTASYSAMEIRAYGGWQVTVEWRYVP